MLDLHDWESVKPKNPLSDYEVFVLVFYPIFLKAVLSRDDGQFFYGFSA